MAFKQNSYKAILKRSEDDQDHFYLRRIKVTNGMKTYQTQSKGSGIESSEPYQRSWTGKEGVE